MVKKKYSKQCDLESFFDCEACARRDILQETTVSPREILENVDAVYHRTLTAFVIEKQTKTRLLPALFGRRHSHSNASPNLAVLSLLPSRNASSSRGAWRCTAAHVGEVVHLDDAVHGLRSELSRGLPTTARPGWSRCRSTHDRFRFL